MENIKKFVLEHLIWNLMIEFLKPSDEYIIFIFKSKRMKENFVQSSGKFKRDKIIHEGNCEITFPKNKVILYQDEKMGNIIKLLAEIKKKGPT